jgi:photosystem II stability/assembly factor-like uncharacterized protein
MLVGSPRPQLASGSEGRPLVGDESKTTGLRFGPAVKDQPEAPSSFHPSVVGLRFVGANPLASEQAEGELPWRTNYLAGDDKSKWRTGVGNFARVSYSHVYPNVDLAYYGNRSQFEYDLTLRPGAKPDKIGIAVDGATHLSIRNGSLLIKTACGAVIERRPVGYQKTPRGTANIPVAYCIKKSGEVGFLIGPHDKSLPLVVDPVLSYSAAFGGPTSTATGTAVDGDGNTYLVGYTTSPGFPHIPPAEGPPAVLAQFVAKLNPSGTAFVYSTIVDTSENDSVNAVAVDQQGEAIVTGTTLGGFGAPLNARPPNSGPDALIFKLSADGSSFIFRTTIGGSGSNYGTAVSTDSSGSAYIAGRTSSPDIATQGAAQAALAGPINGFAAKIDPSGSRIVYCTYFGGSLVDGCNAIAVDPLGNAYLGGFAGSSNIPLVHPVQNSFAGNCVASSTDGGSNWSSAGATLPNPTVTCLAVDPRDGLTALVGTNGTNIYKTVDGGKTWTAHSVGQQAAGGLAIDPATPSIALAVTGVSVMRTTDGGETWKQTYTGLDNLALPSMTLIDPANAGTVYLATSAGVFVSTDTGVTWFRPKLRGLTEFPIVSSLALHSGSPSTLYAGTTAGTVLKSTNQGSRWAVMGSLPSSGFPEPVSTLGVDAKHASTIYAEGQFGGFFSSPDAGKTWVSATNGLNNVPVTAFATDPHKSGILYVATRDGVFKTTDGAANWVPINNGAAAYTTAVVVAPGNSHILYRGSIPLTHGFVAKLDPTGSNFIYSTYLGGNATDIVAAVAADADGNALVTGSTFSTNFPTTQPMQAVNNGLFDAFIARFDPAGSLIYCTYYGGTLDDFGLAIAVDSTGAGYMGGYTYSTDIRMLNPIQASLGGYSDALIAKFQPGGSLSFSTYFGGDYLDYANGIGVDSAGNAYVAGTTASTNFSTTAGAVATNPGPYDVFVLRIDSP